MIAFLSGRLEYLSGGTVVIDVGGVGYEAIVSADVASSLSAMGTGNEVKLYTYTYIREGSLALYGFLSRDDLDIFKLLITVSGVGPKGGLSLLSAMGADDLRFAIVTGDARMIARAPGVGKKTAERLILDLRDKISTTYGGDGEEEISKEGGAGGLAGRGDLGDAAGSPASGGPASPAADAIEALVALGYLRTEATRAVKKCGEKEDTEKILREALRHL